GRTGGGWDTGLCLCVGAVINLPIMVSHARRCRPTSVEFYDMSTGAWRRGAALPRPLYGHASAVLDNSIYVIHGEVLFWDLKGKVWEKRASMSIARFSHRLATAHGYIYALLGMYEPFCDIERYDSKSDHWTRLKPLLTGSFNYGMASTASGNLLVFGGRRWSDGQEVIVKSVLEYDTKRDRWREICQLPRPLTGTESNRWRLLWLQKDSTCILTGFIASVSIFLMSLWSQLLVSRLFEYSMMFVL
uniref:Uncharacterized protein n=1 Tax=Stegastes partitus TaxID=144197 RepID=A0A3B5AH67_9TELE